GKSAPAGQRIDRPACPCGTGLRPAVERAFESDRGAGHDASVKRLYLRDPVLNVSVLRELVPICGQLILSRPNLHAMNARWGVEWNDCRLRQQAQRCSWT